MLWGWGGGGGGGGHYVRDSTVFNLYFCVDSILCQFNSLHNKFMHLCNFVSM